MGDAGHWSPEASNIMQEILISGLFHSTGPVNLLHGEAPGMEVRIQLPSKLAAKLPEVTRAPSVVSILIAVPDTVEDCEPGRLHSQPLPPKFVQLEGSSTTPATCSPGTIPPQVGLAENRAIGSDPGLVNPPSLF